MKHILSVSSLVKEYTGGKRALNGINLTVNKGDFFALLGPNGAGKTSLIGIVTGLITKTEGEVTVYGYSIDTHHDKAKSHIGLVPQEHNFDIFSTVEDILYTQAGYFGLSRKSVNGKINSLIEMLGLTDKRTSQAITLSGGMKRRLMIARALVHSPSLLFLDEPSAGVDVELRYEMWDFLKKLNEGGVTIILTTHYLEEAERLCKHLALIARGEIIKEGTMEEVCQGKKLEEVYLSLTK